MQLVLDGIEDRPYKPAHEVRLFRAVPDAEVAQLVRVSAFQADCREFKSRLPLQH